jgi:hypothetical protein
MNSNKQEIYDLLLETLSFYEPMSLEKIIMDIDSDRAKGINDFNKETLELALTSLQSEKLLNLIKSHDDQKTWIKVFKRKRSWWQRLWPFGY